MLSTMRVTVLATTLLFACLAFGIGIHAATAATADADTQIGTHLNVTGVENLNITLYAIVGTATGSSLPYCQVAGLPEPYTTYNSTSTEPEEDAKALAALFIDVAVGDVGSVTFYGGNVTVAGGPPNEDAPYIYYVSNSTDTGTATGPLYVTKSAVPATPSSKTTMYQLDYAEFVAASAGQIGWVSGSLSGACLWNVTFTAS